MNIKTQTNKQTNGRYHEKGDNKKIGIGKHNIFAKFSTLNNFHAEFLALFFSENIEHFFLSC